ncbi:hypothetical protein CesoFtcFv8_024638 [Champsocephalus esox]|uniref:Uncharacterized protein n=1 Tax=Champsocephalus esox TaxID=159716 RepID=A0AAN8GF88_9TELE|nr:hypothetical protein CesoFtcFv8_024638 [Champsocephalus esox]
MFGYVTFTGFFQDAAACLLVHSRFFSESFSTVWARCGSQLQPKKSPEVRASPLLSACVTCRHQIQRILLFTEGQK